MQQFEVTFSVGSYAGASERTGAFLGTPQMQYVKTVVSAAHNGQARQIVESQFGGSGHCQVHSVFPV